MISTMKMMLIKLIIECTYPSPSRFFKMSAKVTRPALLMKSFKSFFFFVT